MSRDVLLSVLFLQGQPGMRHEDRVRLSGLVSPQTKRVGGHDWFYVLSGGEVGFS